MPGTVLPSDSAWGRAAAPANPACTGLEQPHELCGWGRHPSNRRVCGIERVGEVARPAPAPNPGAVGRQGQENAFPELRAGSGP